MVDGHPDPRLYHASLYMLESWRQLRAIQIVDLIRKCFFYGQIYQSVFMAARRPAPVPNANDLEDEDPPCPGCAPFCLGQSKKTIASSSRPSVSSATTELQEDPDDPIPRAPAGGPISSTRNHFSTQNRARKVKSFKIALMRHYADSIKDNFTAFDKDGSGELDLQEILAAAPQLGMSQEDARQLFLEIDKDKSGTISMAEMRAYLRKKPSSQTETTGNPILVSADAVEVVDDDSALDNAVFESVLDDTPKGDKKTVSVLNQRL